MPPLPNGSRLSCGRNAYQRKDLEPLIVPAGEATQFCPLVSARQLQALVRRRQASTTIGQALAPRPGRCAD